MIDVKREVQERKLHTRTNCSHILIPTSTAKRELPVTGRYASLVVCNPYPVSHVCEQLQVDLKGCYQECSPNSFCLSIVYPRIRKDVSMWFITVMCYEQILSMLRGRRCAVAVRELYANLLNIFF